MRRVIAGLIITIAGSILGVFGTAFAQAEDGEFSLQVSPSPLVLTLKPGETTTHELKIRNTGAKPEKLRIDPRAFSVSSNGEVKLDDTKPPLEISEWTSFSAQEFTIQPGEIYTQKVTFAIPESAGFSYSFSLVITRQGLVSSGTERKLEGKVAIFSLINIDKPGATRTLELQELATTQGVYEYLPASLNLKFKNTGNTIVRPTGTIFIQRGSNDATPISTLPVNPGDGYILPGSARVLAVDWDDGFPVVRKSADAAGALREHVEWNWSNLFHLRVGKYTAKVVAIYNDGQRNVSVVEDVSFWVIPWKLLLGVVVIVAILGIGVWSIASKVFGGVKRKNGVSFSKSRR